MYQDEIKDKRINIRLDDDTFFALKKIVEKDLKTDISSYCRSLLWISTLHESNITRINKAIKQFRETRDTKDLEYMLKIKSEIEFIEKFLQNIKENRIKYDEFILMIEKWHEAIKNEARNYFNIYNELLDCIEKIHRDAYGDEYDTNPTVSKWGKKINI